jgi:hypothetical protein
VQQHVDELPLVTGKEQDEQESEDCVARQDRSVRRSLLWSGSCERYG